MTEEKDKEKALVIHKIQKAFAKVVKAERAKTLRWCKENIECHRDYEDLLVDFIPWSQLEEFLLRPEV